MGFVTTVLGLVGFGWGFALGLVLGYFIFIYLQPNDVKDPIIKPIAELDTKTLQDLLPEIPLWVKNPDYDRVDWLNKFLRDLWPYLDKAICKIISETAHPYMKEYGPKFKLESIEFDSLTLGTLPPTFSGMKVYDTNENEMILEPSVKFAGNPNIIIAVKAFGLKATVQLVDVQVFATARVTLKPLIPIFPCFSKIVVSLMEKPHVDFGLNVLGGDLMAIPGLYGFVQDFIKDQVSQLYMWPKTLEIPVIDSPSALQKPVGILEVTVVRAKNLLKMDVMGKADPFVKLQLVNTLMSKKTRTKKSTLNPEWNETFKLLVQDPKSQSLEIQVYDWDKVGEPEKMGMQVVPLHDLVELEPKTLDLNLLKNVDPNDEHNNKARGVLTIKLLYKAFRQDEQGEEMMGNENNETGLARDGKPQGGGVLEVIVHSAEDVEGRHHTNPYAKVLFRGDERKTQVIKKNRDPKWDQSFQWQLDEPPMDDQVHVEVMSKNTGLHVHSKTESLGYADINLSDVVNNKRVNEKYSLIDSKNGRIQIELTWRTT
ncbi:hypothetical protein BDL97_05G060600 [Sphagnum fallax]|jgi:Ca2+-dependent lipid-binding protein|nr:hypothetical protein BDL97_05G060600 [Sphagnum fallax]KAH8961659.1 hypothetical protein BDL97_05G060600 [Sphagnum fallax]